jgi:hypothetical protein
LSRIIGATGCARAEGRRHAVRDALDEQSGRTTGRLGYTGRLHCRSVATAHAIGGTAALPVILPSLFIDRRTHSLSGINGSTKTHPALPGLHTDTAHCTTLSFLRTATNRWLALFTRDRSGARGQRSRRSVMARSTSGDAASRSPFAKPPTTPKPTAEALPQGPALAA